jgi:hypothetical protein
MARGCPDCAVTQMWEETKEELSEEFARLAERHRVAGGKWKWSMDKVITDVGVAASADASVDGKGYSPGWPSPLKRLVVILREERSNLRRAKDREREAEAKRDRNGGSRYR